MSILVIFSQMYTQHSCKQKIREIIQQWGKNRGRNSKVGSWEDAKMTHQGANIPPLVDDILRQREGRRISAPRFVGGSVDWFSLYRRETWPPLLLICLPCYSLTSQISLDQIRSVSQSCPTLCDPMNHSTPGLPVHRQLLEFTQTQVHWVGDIIQPSHPLSSLLLPSILPSIRVFSNESVLRIRWPKY